MDTAALLWSNVHAKGLCPGANSLEDWLHVRWGRMRVGPWCVPVLPLGPRLRARLVVHDLHHLVTGWDTSYRGEAQLAAWELASGGCGTSAFFWLDRLCFLAIGLALCPRALLPAYRRGRAARNLYGADPAELLKEPFEVLCERVLGSAKRGTDERTEQA